MTSVTRPLLLALLCLLVGVGALPAAASDVECSAFFKLVDEETASRLWPSGNRYRPPDGSCEEGYFHGPIADGDYDKVRQFYRKYHPFLYAFKLNSPGGDVDEAMRIGRLFRKYQITTYAPESAGPSYILGHGTGAEWEPLCAGSDCACASACALMWFGGVERSGTVGLHRPRIDDPAFKALRGADATKVYIRILLEIARYLEEMEVPRPMIDAMVATGSSEIRWIDSIGDDLFRPPSIAEWEDAACSAFNKEGKKALSGLFGKKYDSSLTANEKLLMQMLDDKRMNRDGCLINLRYREVDRLTPP